MPLSLPRLYHYLCLVLQPHRFAGYRASHKAYMAGVLISLLLLISGCGANGFHFRGDASLSAQYHRLYLQGLDINSDFAKDIRDALQEVGSDLVSQPDKADAILHILKYDNGKRVASYGKDREVREYLIYLRINYRVLRRQDSSELIPLERINIDKTQEYDSQYVLGKVEEERLINEALRKDAARHILVRLRYGNSGSGR